MRLKEEGSLLQKYAHVISSQGIVRSSSQALGRIHEVNRIPRCGSESQDNPIHSYPQGCRIYPYNIKVDRQGIH